MPLTLQGRTAQPKVQKNLSYEPSRESIQSENAYDPTANWDWQNQQKLGPQGEALPVLATGWRPTGEADFGGGFGGWVKKAVSKIETSYWLGHEEGLKISGITKFALEKTKGEEEAAATVAEMEAKRKPTTEGIADFTAALEGTKEIFNQALWGILDGLAVGGYAVEQGLGAVGYSISDISKGKNPDWEKNWQAGRLAYSSVFYEGVRAEMERNIEQGMRSDIAAEEILSRSMDAGRKGMMWVELGGQLVLDPLNVVALWGKVGKGGKAANMISKNSKVYQKATPAARKILDAIIGAATEADRVEALSRLGDSQAGLRLLADFSDEIVETGKGLETWSKSYRAGELTSSGKMAHLADHTGEILQHVINNSESTDEMAEIIRAMAKSASLDAAERAEGIAGMMRFADPEALLSEAGRETTSMLARAAEKYPTWLDDIAKAGKEGGQPELAKLLFGRMDEIGQEMFPTVEKLMDAEKAVKALTKAGKAGDIAPNIAKFAEQAGKLPPFVRWTAAQHGRMQMVVGPINKFFVGAYMGWSPGYAVRNLANNTFTVFVDEGPRALFNVNKNMDLANTIHGSDLLEGINILGKNQP